MVRILLHKKFYFVLALVIIISASPVFASQTVDQYVERQNNFQVWQQLENNISVYYGDDNASLSDTQLISIDKAVTFLKYYYADQTQTLYMYVPSTNSVQSISGRHLPEILSYINYNLSYAAQHEYESELLLSRLVTQMGGTNGSYVQDIALDIDAYLPALTELTDFNTIGWEQTTCQMIGVFDGPTSSANEITTFNSSLSYTDYYFRFSAMPNTENNIFRVKLPIYTNSIRWRNDIVDQLEVLYGTNDMMPISLTYDISNSGLWLDIYFSAMPTSINSYFQIHLKTGHNCNLRTTKPYIEMLPYDSLDSMLVQYKGYLANIHNDLQNLKVDLSGSDITVSSDFDDSAILEAIDNLSLTNNDVKLNLTINNNTGSDGSNIIGRLQNFFNTGTSISDFFDNVDDAESGWFTQTNSDLINTLSGGYVNLYE